MDSSGAEQHPESRAIWEALARVTPVLPLRLKAEHSWSWVLFCCPSCPNWPSCFGCA